MKKITHAKSVQKPPKKLKTPSRISALCSKFQKLCQEKQAGIRDYGRPCLGELPRKALLLIMDELPIESQAMIQLVCRSLNKKLQGRHVDGKQMKTCSLTRRNILALLARDDPYPYCILCSWCCQFHRPQASSPVVWPWETWYDTRKCAAWANPKFNIWGQVFEGVSPFLPWTIHFNMVKAIMKSHNSPRPPIYTPEMLASTRNMQPEGGIQVQIKNDLKIVKGSLLLKTQTLIWKPDTILTCGDAPSALCLWKLFHENRHYLHACKHETYASNMGPSSFRFLFCPYECGQDGSHARLAKDHKRHECTWQHPQPCKCLFAPPWGKVYACRWCYTDIAVDMQKVPRSRNGPLENSKVIILTTWKDLGKGQRHKDPKWQSHLAAKEEHESTAFIRGTGTDVYKAYEAVGLLNRLARYEPGNLGGS